MDYWATQSILYTIPQLIPANLSPPVMTTTHDADKHMTVGFQPHSLGSPLVSPCPTACGPSRRPPATSAWPNMAINTKKRAENEQKRRNSVSSETGTPSSKNPQTIVGNDGKGFRSYSPDDAPSQIGLPPLPASISKQNRAKPRTYGQTQPFLDFPFAKPCETPRLHSGNLPALNATHLDVFWRHSEPVSSIPGPRHGGTMFPSSQDPPASKSTRIDAFSRVSNSMLPRTGPPHLSASSPTRSEVLRLDFEPNTTILSPGPLSYQPDDGSSSPFALAGSPRPETTSMSPEGSLASKTTKYVSSGGNHYHPALLSLNRTPAEPWAHSEWRNEAMTALGHTENEGAGNQFSVWKGKDRLASETPHIAAWDHVATEAPAHSMNELTHQSVASGSTEPYTPDEETQVPLGLLARQ